VRNPHLISDPVSGGSFMLRSDFASYLRAQLHSQRKLLL
jgi:hypothetical protein